MSDLPQISEAEFEVMKIVCFNPPKFIKKFLRLFKRNKQNGEKVETKEKE